MSAETSDRFQQFSDVEVEWLADVVDLAEDFAASIEETQGLVRVPSAYLDAGTALKAELEAERARRGLPGPDAEQPSA